MDVLVVEDTPTYQRAVEQILTKNGHQVRCAGTLAEADAELSSRDPDLVILDLMLPDGDGIDFCVNIRPRSNAYILMLTARDDEMDKVTGLRCGADDYVSKPFSPRELEARIQSIARRQRITPTLSQPAAVASQLAHRDVSANCDLRTANVGDTRLDLTRVEFDLLALLMSRPSQVLTRSQILDDVWGYDWYGDDHILDVHIGNLRRKLRAAGADNFIRTVRGVGYGLILQDN